MHMKAETCSNRGKQKEQSLAWLVGQYVDYIMQFSDQFKLISVKFGQEIGFKKGCVGVHVRRTDKIKEMKGKYYELSEYMKHVDLYYAKYPNKDKCVFLITDEKKVITEAKTK